MKNTIIELKVRNHPGVMSHVVNLFSRKAISLDIMYYAKQKNVNSSKILIMINNNINGEYLLKQLYKLHDIIDVKVHKKFAEKKFKELYLYIINALK